MHVLFFLFFSRLLICLCVCYCILYLCYHFYGEIKFIYNSVLICTPTGCYRYEKQQRCQNLLVDQRLVPQTL